MRLKIKSEKKSLWLIRFIGIILLIFILTRIDLSSVAYTITKVNLWYLALAIILILPVIFFKSWRWQSLLKTQGITYPLRQAFLAYFSGIYLGLATPGRLGEFARVLYLTDDKELSVSEAFSSVLVDRLCDVYLLLIVIGYALIAFSLLGGETIIAVIILAFLLALSLLLLNRQIGTRLIRIVYKAKVLKRFERRMDTFVEEFYSGIQGLVSSRLVFPVLLTVAAYTVYFGQCYLLALSLNLPLSFFYVGACMAVSFLVAMIPVSIAGIGTRDAALIALFSLRGVTAESALSYSLLVLFTFYIATAVMGVVAWQIKPLMRKIVNKAS